MSALDKIKQQAKAAGAGVDMNKAFEGGGDYKAPPPGKAKARFIGYYEFGQHEVPDFNDKTKTKLAWKVRLVFELSGKNYPKSENGTPIRISIDETYEPGKAPGSKSNFFKIFNKMNYAGKATHIAELLGDAFLIDIFNGSSADGKRTFATCKGSPKTTPKGDGYVITGPTIYDAVSEKDVAVPVDPPSTEPAAFFWLASDLDDFDALFIDGEYPEVKDEATGEVKKPARSKNVLQEMIMKAKNWKDHPLAAQVAARAAGQKPGIDVPDAEQPPRSEAPAGADDGIADDDIPF